MARKRMFDSEVINQDSFFDLPMEAKALYFLLGMEADDEGFVSPRKVMRLYGGTDDSIRILAMKNFIIPFETGVIVITDWQNNNWLDTRRTKPTIYQEEKSRLLLDKNSKKYILAIPCESKCLAPAKQMLRENRIEENSIEENSIYIVENEKEKNKTEAIKEIVDYLNLKINSKYRATTRATKDSIVARLNENFTVDDFKTVIDKQYSKWKNTEYEQYLRPQTLFGTKFESYLNAPTGKKDNSVDWNAWDQKNNKISSYDSKAIDDLIQKGEIF